ncbi:hypothetical protein GOODEAATRI_025104, partial [Goodea atripinnis]
LLPADWSNNKELYSLRYQDDSDTQVVLKAITVDSTLIFNLMLQAAPFGPWKDQLWPIKQGRSLIKIKGILAPALTRLVVYQTSCLLELFPQELASTRLDPLDVTDRGETHGSLSVPFLTIIAPTSGQNNLIDMSDHEKRV